MVKWFVPGPVEFKARRWQAEQAPEVVCVDGKLSGAHFSDHGYVIIGMRHGKDKKVKVAVAAAAAAAAVAVAVVVVVVVGGGGGGGGGAGGCFWV